MCTKNYPCQYVYHFTHMSNLAQLFSTGLLANNHPDFPISNHLSVAEKTIQERRAKMVVTCGPQGVVHDYVPLYFSSISPMLLAVINKKKIDQEDIVYFEFPINIIERCDFVFTSAAANTEIPPIFYSDANDLNLLNWERINSLEWKSPSDEIKQKRMAELLIHNKLELKEVERFVVFSEKKRLQIIKIAEEARFSLPQIQVHDAHNRRHFFTDFAAGNPYESCIAGPNEVKKAYEKVTQEYNSRTIHEDYPFENISDLLKSLRRDFGALPYTKELIDLEVENPAHDKNVDKHILSVIDILKRSSEFHDLSDSNKTNVELAAYLHDIGKGPKSRWQKSESNKKNNGKQKTDNKHPVRATPMLIDIFCNYVKVIGEQEVNQITFLVLYHDFFGDVMGNVNQNIGDNRSTDEITKGFTYGSECIYMLFALSKADSLSLSEEWWRDEKATKILDILLRKE